MKNTETIVREIAADLLNKYYNYYCTVHFDFIVDAVKNAIYDLQGVCDLDDLHECIKENYI